MLPCRDVYMRETNEAQAKNGLDCWLMRMARSAASLRFAGYLRRKTMNYTVQTSHVGRIALCALAVAGLGIARPALAQSDGYHVDEDRPAPPAPRTPPVAPHRLARIEYISGNVTWRANSKDKWSKAGVNRALNEGAEIWAEDGARVELRFDDGSPLRLGSNGVVTLQTVYVDAQDEYTQVKMLSGVATLEPCDSRSVFEIVTPLVNVKTTGPSRVRVGVGDDVEIAVGWGQANLGGPPGKINLIADDFVAVRAADTSYALHSLPAPDSWEAFNDERDRKTVAASYPVYHDRPVSHSSTSVFLSLGFPLFSGGGYHDPY